MEIIKPPLPIIRREDTNYDLSIFLAGSIEMGAAIDWQKELQDGLNDLNILLYNPRRDDWDISWKQSIDNENFRGQVEWELNGLNQSDLAIFYFDPNTKSPITLMELGLMAATPNKTKNIIVCCPEPFWRKGNVDIVCQFYGKIQQVNTLDELISEIRIRASKGYKMSDQFEKEIMRYLNERYSILTEKMYLSSSLRDELGLDSLDIVELVMFCEDKFGYLITSDEESSIITIGNLVDILRAKVK